MTTTTATELNSVDRPALVFLRAEGLAALAVATAAYFILGGSWWLFAILFFAPDLSFVGYGAGRKTGAYVYNLAHSYAVAAAIGGLGYLVGNDLLQQLALIQAAHIGFDRSLGYGVKLQSGFKHTHLGTMGRR